MHIRLYRDVVAIPQHPGNRVQVPVVDAMELTLIRDVERLMVEEELLSELKRLRDVSMKLTKDDERLEIDSVVGRTIIRAIIPVPDEGAASTTRSQ